MKPKISIKFIICFLPLIFYLAAPLAVVCEGDEAAIDQMEIKRSIQQFKNDDIEIRKKVASSLARYPKAVPLLIKGLDDKDWRVRNGAVHTLFFMGSSDSTRIAIPALVKAFKHEKNLFPVGGG